MNPKSTSSFGEFSRKTYSKMKYSCILVIVFIFAFIQFCSTWVEQIFHKFYNIPQRDIRNEWKLWRPLLFVQRNERKKQGIPFKKVSRITNTQNKKYEEEKIYPLLLNEWSVQREMKKKRGIKQWKFWPNNSSSDFIVQYRNKCDVLNESRCPQNGINHHS